MQPPGQGSNPTAKVLPSPTLPRLPNPVRSHKRAHRLTLTLTWTPQSQQHPLPRPQTKGPRARNPSGRELPDVPSRSRLEWAEASGVDQPRGSSRAPFSLVLSPSHQSLYPLFSPSPRRSGPLSAATSQSGAASPRLGGPALVFPGSLAGLPCLTRSGLWRVLRLLLTTAQLLKEEEGRAGCADGSEK